MSDRISEEQLEKLCELCREHPEWRSVVAPREETLKALREVTAYRVLERNRQSPLQDVRDFQKKFDIPMPSAPQLLAPATQLFRSGFLQEELDEFNDAWANQDLHKTADALVDLAYVLYGTVLMMGLGDVWEQLWAEVQRANMSKERAKPDGSNSKRGSSLDVIKPEGWVGPDFIPILGPNIVPPRHQGDEITLQVTKEAIRARNNMTVTTPPVFCTCVQIQGVVISDRCELHRGQDNGVLHE